MNDFEYWLEKIENAYGFKPDLNTFLTYLKWYKLFVEYNSHTNLMSKNDIGVIFEKHVLDSLAVVLLKEFKTGAKLLDIGAGGGFPSLILAIFFPDVEIIALDSIYKKIKFLQIAKNELNLANFTICCKRVQSLAGLGADIITNRAVGKIVDVYKAGIQNLKKGGIFVSYKAFSAKKEAYELLKYDKKLAKPEFIRYELPLKENYTRYLVVFRGV